MRWWLLIDTIRVRSCGESDALPWARFLCVALGRALRLRGSTRSERLVSISSDARNAVERSHTGGIRWVLYLAGARAARVEERLAHNERQVRELECASKRTHKHIRVCRQEVDVLVYRGQYRTPRQRRARTIEPRETKEVRAWNVRYASDTIRNEAA